MRSKARIRVASMAMTQMSHSDRDGGRCSTVSSSSRVGGSTPGRETVSAAARTLQWSNEVIFSFPSHVTALPASLPKAPSSSIPPMRVPTTMSSSLTLATSALATSDSKRQRVSSGISTGLGVKVGVVADKGTAAAVQHGGDCVRSRFKRCCDRSFVQCIRRLLSWPIRAHWLANS